MSRVLATYNIKGGVGKTSAAVNLAYLAAREGARTLLWDLDPQGASTYLFRVKPKVKGGGRKLVRGKSDVDGADQGHRLRAARPAAGRLLLPPHGPRARRDQEARRGGLARVLAPLADDYDYIFLDCPPSISLVSESVFEAADALLVPLIPATLSSRTFEQLRDVVRRPAATGRSVLAFFSMVDRRKRLHREVMERARRRASTTCCAAAIPAAADVERMGVHRTAVAEFAPRSRAALAYEALWDEVRERLDGGSPRRG